MAFAARAVGLELAFTLGLAFTDFVFRVTFPFEFDEFLLRVVFFLEPVLIFTTTPVLGLGAAVAGAAADASATVAGAFTCSLPFPFFSASVAAFIALSK